MPFIARTTEYMRTRFISVQDFINNFLYSGENCPVCGTILEPDPNGAFGEMRCSECEAVK